MTLVFFSEMIREKNYPMLVHTFGGKQDDVLKYNYITHTSLDVIEERRVLLSFSNRGDHRG